MTTAIDIAGLHKAFGDHTVLDDLDLQVGTGTVYALLGPNGAGKTTVVKILATLLSPDAGTIRVGGHDLATDPEGVRAAIGVTGQFSAVDGLLTGRENLRLMADLRHLGRREGGRRVAELLERFDLADAADKPSATYSGGMRRRLDLGMTLLGNPEIVFLDEPTTGLDPHGRRAMWDTVRTLVADGITILLTTQYLEEADQLAGRVGVLDRGQLVAEGTPSELKSRVPGGHVRLRFADTSALARVETLVPGATPDLDALTLDVAADDSPRALRGLLERVDDPGLLGVTVHTPDLDDVFLALTGREAPQGRNHETGTREEIPA